MKGIKIYHFIFLSGIILASCTAASKRKSADYYYQHKTTIEEVRTLFDQLYYHQPFSAGFSDRSFQYYLLEVTTDSVRYIYNTEKNRPQMEATVLKFGYDTTALLALARQLKAIKCLWISKRSFYVNLKRDTVTFLSFKSVNVDKPFMENKYYTLVFLPRPIASETERKKVKRGALVKIDELVYFTIGTKFR